ncbi:MAG: glycoside hydrolase family 27 protein [Clostridia bacterium]|nr:glycoside hydrolase family 27 protein [Clostridia bacterium]
MVVSRPPMGWNSWNTFGPEIDEQTVRSMADVMVSEGYLAAGYEYLVIDDCWALRERDANGRMVPNPEKFPSGMKAVADYVHSKGLKFGIYSCVGNYTCAGFPGSFEYEFIDAETFAEWGVDFLKLDYCYKPFSEPGARLYRRMALALDNCGRDILLSACSWGADETHRWIKTTGSSMWRSTGDIVDAWTSIKNIYEIQRGIYEYNGALCFNDMDMLVVGMYHKGNVGITGCTLEEYRTHFSIWAFFGSPLMMGSDIRTADADIKAILQNPAVIAVDQDPAFRQPFTVNGNPNVWARHMSDGDIVLGIFNVNDNPMGVFVPFSELGIGRVAGRGFRMTDLWTGEDLGVKTELFTLGVKAHESRLFRLKLTKL